MRESSSAIKRIFLLGQRPSPLLRWRRDDVGDGRSRLLNERREQILADGLRFALVCHVDEHLSVARLERVESVSSSSGFVWLP